MLNKIKVAYLNDTMGPYHYERLRSANKHLDCIFIEFSSHDHVNLWKPNTKEMKKKIVLFKDKSIIEQSPSDIKKKIDFTLYQNIPDVVLISGWDSICSLLSALWCLRNGIPMIILSESQEIDFRRSFFIEFIKSQLIKLFDSAFVGGVNQKKYLIKLGFNSSRIFKGCDIVDNSHFLKMANDARDKADSKIMKNLGLPKRYFFTSCRLVKKKNLKFLVKAFKSFSIKNKSWKLLIAGDGPQKEDLLNLVSSLGLNEKVIFLGYVSYDEIPKYYAMSSCFILPSTTEQWGLVVNEALASGIPVIISERCGSAAELVLDNDVGYIFDPYDSDDLIDKMTKMVDSDIRLKFSSNTYKVISKYNSSYFGESLMKASESAIKNYDSNKSVFSKIILKTLILYKNLK